MTQTTKVDFLHILSGSFVCHCLLEQYFKMN